MSRLVSRMLRAGAAGVGIGLLVVTSFAVWAITSAEAGSLKDDEPFITTPMSRVWNGCYIGIAAGASIDDTSVITSAPVTAVTGTASDGFTAGGYLGCSLTAGNFVYGVEGDYNFASEDPEFYGSIRARLGATIAPTTLLYVTGGYAAAEQDFVATIGANTFAISRRAHGYVVGGGIEQAVATNGAFRFEVLHYDYDPIRFSDGTGDGARVAQAHTVVRVGVSVSLNDLFGSGSAAGSTPTSSSSDRTHDRPGSGETHTPGPRATCGPDGSGEAMPAALWSVVGIRDFGLPQRCGRHNPV